MLFEIFDKCRGRRTSVKTVDDERVAGIAVDHQTVSVTLISPARFKSWYEHCDSHASSPLNLLNLGELYPACTRLQLSVSVHFRHYGVNTDRTLPCDSISCSGTFRISMRLLTRIRYGTFVTGFASSTGTASASYCVSFHCSMVEQSLST